MNATLTRLFLQCCLSCLRAQLADPAPSSHRRILHPHDTAQLLRLPWQTSEPLSPEAQAAADSKRQRHEQHLRTMLHPDGERAGVDLATFGYMDLVQYAAYQPLLPVLLSLRTLRERMEQTASSHRYRRLQMVDFLKEALCTAVRLQVSQKIRRNMRNDYALGQRDISCPSPSALSVSRQRNQEEDVQETKQFTLFPQGPDSRINQAAFPNRLASAAFEPGSHLCSCEANIISHHPLLPSLPLFTTLPDPFLHADLFFFSNRHKR